jgi:lactam utilization protein B
LSTKIHAVVDENGLPVRLSLTAGQAHDRRAVDDLLVELLPGADVVADRAYDGDGVLELIARAGAKPHIPTTRRRRVQRSVDPALYRSTQPDRALLLQAQALPTYRNPLRQARPQLPRRRDPRIDTPMAQSL